MFVHRMETGTSVESGLIAESALNKPRLVVTKVIAGGAAIVKCGNRLPCSVISLYRRTADS